MTNPMRAISVGKVVVNIGVGEAGEKLLKAVKVLELVTGHKPGQTLSRSTIRDWGIRRNMPIGTVVTLRGEDAFAFLKKALAIRSNRLAGDSFDPHGDFSFGIPDYTDFEGMRDAPESGVFGVGMGSVRPPFNAEVVEGSRGRSSVGRRAACGAAGSGGSSAATGCTCAASASGRSRTNSASASTAEGRPCYRTRSTTQWP